MNNHELRTIHVDNGVCSMSVPERMCITCREIEGEIQMTNTMHTAADLTGARVIDPNGKLGHVDSMYRNGSMTVVQWDDDESYSSHFTSHVREWVKRYYNGSGRKAYEFDCTFYGIAGESIHQVHIAYGIDVFDAELTLDKELRENHRNHLNYGITSYKEVGPVTQYVVKGFLRNEITGEVREMAEKVVDAHDAVSAKMVYFMAEIESLTDYDDWMPVRGTFSATPYTDPTT